MTPTWKELGCFPENSSFDGGQLADAGIIYITITALVQFMASVSTWMPYKTVYYISSNKRPCPNDRPPGISAHSVPPVSNSRPLPLRLTFLNRYKRNANFISLTRMISRQPRPQCFSFRKWDEAVSRGWWYGRHFVIMHIDIDTSVLST